MGKALIIPSVSWAQKNLGKVTFVQPDMLFIGGEGIINGESVYTAMIGGSAVNAQWSINDASLAELSVNEGESITLTPLASGDIILTASYEGKTATRNITMSVEQPDEAITQGNLTNDMMRYLNINGYTRSVMYIPFNLDNADSWDIEVSIAKDSPIKAGFQYHDIAYIIGESTSSPTIGDTTNVCYDSGWINPSSSKYGDESNNKDNSVGTAGNSRRPSYIALVFTYTNGNGFPTFEEFMQNVEFSFTYSPRTTHIVTQENLTSADYHAYTTGGGARALVYLYLDKFHKWNMNMAVAQDSTIMVGIQYHDYQMIWSGGGQSDPQKISWDSGWILPGGSQSCDQTRNKSNTIGSNATSSKEPTSIALAFTYNSAGNGSPTFEEFMKYVSFELELIPEEV